MFKVSTSLVHACLQSLTKVLDSLCHRFLRKVIPDRLQCGFKPVARTVRNFCKRLQACADKVGGHFEHFNVIDFMLNRLPVDLEV